MADDYRFGIEEEYFLADARTGWSPGDDAADRFHAAAADAIEPVSHELLKGQVEVCTKPDTDPDAAYRSLRAMRGTLSRIAADTGLSLFAAGSHPLAEAKEQSTTESERYQRLEAEFGIIANRSMVCATHIHVEVPDPDQRIPLMNRLMPFLPLFLALSVASPFWQRRDSGLQGFRLAAFSEWPRMGLPEIFAGQDEYDRFVALLVKAERIRDASFIWWLIRPSTHYPTLELRICDSCTDVRHTVAIATLYRCLVRALIRRPALSRPVGPVERGVCAENIWQAQRHGLGATFVDGETGECTGVADYLETVLERVAEDAAALGCSGWLDATREIVRSGTSADLQTTAFRDARARGADNDAALRSVIGELARRTAA
jgi:carboxylate-amine ligase